VGGKKHPEFLKLMRNLLLIVPISYHKAAVEKLEGSEQDFDAAHDQKKSLFELACFDLELRLIL
jgi:hypothetical protein